MEHTYLAPDLNKLESFTVTDDMVRTTEKGRIKRLIFEEVEYDEYQMEKIKELSRFLKKEGISEYSNTVLLKFLYLSRFDFTECIRRMNIYEEWRHNPLIQGRNRKAETILKDGTLYCYGRDRMLRPVVIFRASEVDLSKHPLSDYYWALNKLMEPIESTMLVPGKVEKILIILDINHATLALSVLANYSKIISKIATVYMHRAHKIIMLNVGLLLHFIYKSNKARIESETSEIIIIDSSGLDQLQEYIPADELEAKYGGNKPNLKKFWPIQATNSEVMTKRRQLKEYFGESESSFESLNNQEANFANPFQKRIQGQACCCDCILF